MSDHDLTVALGQLAEVKGQLTVIAQMIQQHSASTHQRIDDLRHSIDGRLAGFDVRVATLERHERETALRAASAGAVAGTASAAIVAGAMKLLTGGG